MKLLKEVYYICPALNGYLCKISLERGKDPHELIRFLRKDGIAYRVWGLPSAQNLDKIIKQLNIPKEELGWQVFDLAAEGLDRFNAPRHCPPDVRAAVLKRGYSPALFIPKKQKRVYPRRRFVYEIS